MTVGTYLEKVFLALRPGFFPEYEKEHITLQYFNGIRWQELMYWGYKLDDMLPATIVLKEHHRWFAGKTMHQGFLVSSPDSPILDHLNMPHITLPKEHFDSARTIEAKLEHPEVSVVDTLWLGKSVGGEYSWYPFDKRQKGFNGHDYSRLQF